VLPHLPGIGENFAMLKNTIQIVGESLYNAGTCWTVHPPGLWRWLPTSKRRDSTQPNIAAPVFYVKHRQPFGFPLRALRCGASRRHGDGATVRRDCARV